MSEELKLQGTNAVLTVNAQGITLERKKGVSLLDYLGDPITKISFAELARVDFQQPNLIQTGYFHFFKKGDKLPTGRVPARQLRGDRQTIFVNMAGSTNILDLKKVYEAVNSKMGTNRTK